MLEENDRRNNIIYAPFNPITGMGSVGHRVRICIHDFVMPVQYVPESMLSVPFVQKLITSGSIEAFMEKVLHIKPNDDDFHKVARKFIRLRCLHDFPFWAAYLVRIHNKDAGTDVLFRLRYPQRILVEHFEAKRLAGQPIRLILLKARQWGGSTLTLSYYI